jgi:hypothetical protein
MELAQTIVGVAAQQLRENSMAEACQLKVLISYPHPEDEYEEWLEDTHIITATPMCQHVLLQYKGISLKLTRADKAAWEDTVGFLYTTIKGHFFCLFDGIPGVGPDAPPPQRYDMMLKVTAKDTEVCAAKMYSSQGWEALETKLRTCLMTMRHVAALQ